MKLPVRADNRACVDDSRAVEVFPLRGFEVGDNKDCAGVLRERGEAFDRFRGRILCEGEEALVLLLRKPGGKKELRIADDSGVLLGRYCRQLEGAPDVPFEVRTGAYLDTGNSHDSFPDTAFEQMHEL